MKYGTWGLFYDGKFQDAKKSGVIEVNCPANGETLASVAYAGIDDVEATVASAKKGFKFWQKLSIDERLVWMHKFRDALIAEKDKLLECLMRETGKNLGTAEDDFDKLQKALHYFPIVMKDLDGGILSDDEGNAEHKITYSPIGPVAAYLAWNFPLLNLGYKIGPALAAGCSIVVKPSSRTPLTNLLVAEISQKIDFPAGVFNVVPGDNSGFGNGLTAHKDIAGITMIGSAESARKIIAASATSIKRFSLELGGNAPFIVFDDADLDAAAELLVILKTANTGQICVSPNRVFVHTSVKKSFISKLKELLGKQKLGFPLEDTDAGVGPMIAESEAMRVKDLIRRAVDAGAVVASGGNDGPGSAFVTPHLLVDVEPDNPIFSEEIFGPVIAVYDFDDDDTVLELANKTDTGLASYIYTRNIDRTARFSRDIEAGEVMVNGAKWDIHLPHIGIKNSGIGVDCSRYALHDYLFMKRVTTMI